MAGAESPAGMGTATWINSSMNEASWTGDTLFRPILDYFAFGSTTPGCEFSSTTTNAEYHFETTSGSCLATWLQAYYSIIKQQIDYPVVATMGGPDLITTTGTSTWTVQGSGGITGSFLYWWGYKPDGASDYTQICNASTQCSITIGPSSPSFTLRADVSTQRHSGPTGTTTVSVGTTKNVVVVAPLSVSITGPQQLQSSSVVCTWTGSNNGTPPFTYYWYGRLSGSSSTVTGGISHSGSLYLRVTDATGRVGVAAHTIEVLSSYPAGC